MTRQPGIRGPRAARWLVERLLPPEEAARLLDALDEELVEFQEHERGRRRARLWYWGQALRSARILRGRRLAIGAARRGSAAGSRLADAFREVRLIVRALRRTPAFTVMAVATLALGIGTTTTLFSVIDQVVLRPLPYRDPDRIIRAWTRTDDGDVEDFSFRVVEYQELARTGRFEAIGGEFPINVPVVLPGQPPFQVLGRMITPDFFDVFGTRPALGRMFRAGEVAAGDARVVVVTHRFWTRYLGGSRSAVDDSLELSGRPYTLIGVLPSDYRHVSAPDVDVFVPYTIGTAGWIGRWLALYARIPPASTPGEAAHEISAVMAAIARTDRRSRGWHATVSTLHEMVVSDVRRTAWATFAASALLLAIACANVANLMLARGAVRTREFALRLALGASRARLARQVLIESAVVAAGGGVLGAMGAWLGVRALVVLAPPTVPRISEVALDPVAALFCAGLVAVTTAACGLVPAARLTRSLAVASGLGRAASHPARFGGLASGLVMAEVAMAAAIVVAAGLLVRTVQVLNEQEYGFRRDAALSFRVNPPSSRWPGLDGTLAFYRTLRAGLLAIPGVTAVGAGSDLPLAGQGAVASVTSEERVAAGLLEGVTVLQRRAGTGYFEALGTPLLAGRVFDDRDGPATPRVAVVSESLARTLFPGREAVGRRVALGGQPRDADWMTVIGVVADMRFAQADRVDDPQIYQAHVQSPSREMALVVRTEEVPGAVAAVKATLAAVDPGVPAYEITSLDGLVGRAIAGAEFTSWLFALFGLSALVLAAAGIYAVVAFAVGCRRRELGVRLALGATPGGVVRLVVGQGMRVVLAGLFLGLAGTIAGARVLDGLLYGVEATDAGTYAVTAIILTAAGLGACYLPARQSVLPDPVHVLRAE